MDGNFDNGVDDELLQWLRSCDAALDSVTHKVKMFILAEVSMIMVILFLAMLGNNKAAAHVAVDLQCKAIITRKENVTKTDFEFPKEPSQQSHNANLDIVHQKYDF